MPVSFVSSHRLVFRGTYANTCKPHYSLPFSPSCLIISVGFIISLLFPTHHPHCNWQTFAIAPYKWNHDLLSCFYFPVTGSHLPRDQSNSQHVSESLDLVGGPEKQPSPSSFFQSQAYSQWLPHPGDLSNGERALPVHHSGHLRMGPANSGADEKATTILILWCPTVSRKMESPSHGPYYHKPSMSWLPGHPSPALASWAS